MNRSSSRGIKLTTVILAVVILALSALWSSNATAENMDVTKIKKENVIF
ncbi:hypothetical protein [Thalassotalea ganghwensis]